MSKLTLYNKDNICNDAGRELDQKAKEFLLPIFKEYCDLGYSPREISHVIFSALAFHESLSVITNKCKSKNGVKNESN